MVLLSLAAGSKASAQGYTTDARQVAMGGGGSNSNIANTMMRPVRSYGVIPVPRDITDGKGGLHVDGGTDVVYSGGDAARQTALYFIDLMARQRDLGLSSP
jgi:hypothetical protein